MFTNLLFTVLFLILKSECLLWVELCPPKRYEPQVPMNVNLFGNRVFCRYNQIKMRL